MTQEPASDRKCWLEPSTVIAGLFCLMWPSTLGAADSASLLLGIHFKQFPSALGEGRVWAALEAWYSSEGESVGPPLGSRSYICLLLLFCLPLPVCAPLLLPVGITLALWPPASGKQFPQLHLYSFLQALPHGAHGDDELLAAWGEGKKGGGVRVEWG